MDELLRNAAIQLIEWAKQEDLGAGDITTALMAEPEADSQFEVVVKQECVIAGVEVAPLILAAYSPHISIAWKSGIQDGARIASPPASIAVVRGSLADILSAERVFLNFVQRMCGVATMTDRFVRAIAGTNAFIYDTRKTVPGWRLLDKYAVRCGGGKNHRAGLYDAVLIKDNHLAGVPTERLAATVFDMLNRLDPGLPPPAWVEVEAANLAQVKELCKVLGVNMILLDNFPMADIAQAVTYRNAIGLQEKIEMEASGGVNLGTVRGIAETGIERISVGAITHSAPAIDISLERV